MVNEDEIISDSEDITTFDELEDACVKLEKRLQEVKKSYSSFKKEHVCCNSKINELLKIKDDYIAKLYSHNDTLEN